MKNQKGTALILLALLLVVILMLVGVAVDLSYMYNAKNQLQVASDASALAGAAYLDGTDSVLQIEVRQAAWKFACLNKSAGSKVYLANNIDSCDALPGDINNSNDPGGDVVLGYWDAVNRSFVTPLPADKIVNAVKVVARRTGEAAVPNIKTGDDPVPVFFGKIFRTIGVDWSKMSAKADAIAGMPLRGTGIIALCDGISCSSRPNCVYNPPSVTQPCILDPPIILETGDQSVVSPHEPFAWTTLLTYPTSATMISGLTCNNTSDVDVCDSNIWTTMGSDVSDLRQLESVFADPSTPKDEDDGWWITVPVTQSCPPGQQGQGVGWDPKMASGMAKIRVKLVCAAGLGQGALCPDRPYHVSQPLCNAYQPYNSIIVIDRILCIDCSFKDNVIGQKPVLLH